MSNTSRSVRTAASQLLPLAAEDKEDDFIFDSDEFQARWDRLFPRYGALWSHTNNNLHAAATASLSSDSNKDNYIAAPSCDCGLPHSFLPDELLLLESTTTAVESPSSIDLVDENVGVGAIDPLPSNNGHVSEDKRNDEHEDSSSGDSPINFNHISFHGPDEEEEEENLQRHHNNNHPEEEDRRKEDTGRPLEQANDSYIYPSFVKYGDPKDSDDSSRESIVNFNHISFCGEDENKEEGNLHPYLNHSVVQEIQEPLNSFTVESEVNISIVTGTSNGSLPNTPCFSSSRPPVDLPSQSSKPTARQHQPSPPQPSSQWKPHPPNRMIEILSSDDDDDDDALGCRSPVFAPRAVTTTTRETHQPPEAGWHDPKETGDKDYVFVRGETNNSEDSEADEEVVWVDDEDHYESSNKVQNSSIQLSATGDDDDDDDDDSSLDQLVKRTETICILSSDEEDENNASQIGGEAQKPGTSRRPKHPPQSRSRAPTKPRGTFRRQREALSQQWMQDYDRMAFGGRLLERSCDGNPKLTLKWSNKLRTTAGITRLTKEMRRPVAAAAAAAVSSQQDDLSRNYVYTAVIELSTKVLDQESRLRETLAHEMCHAAAWIVDRNGRPAHGPVFRKWAATAMRTLGVQVTTTHSYVIDFRYQWQCTTPQCPAIFQRHSRSIDVTKQVCGRCRGRLVEVVSHSKQQRKQPRPASAYNLFVQAESQRVRQRLESLRPSDAGPTARNGSTTTARAAVERCRAPPVTQAQVLKECARLWQSQKESGSGNGE